MAQRRKRSFNATFVGGQNHGLQQGSFFGQQTNIFSTTGLASPPPRPPPDPSAVIPFRRDRDFVERDVLSDLWQRASEPAARTGLVGLGGVGKTQLGIEYAYRVRNDDLSRWVFWVHASSVARFEESYKQIAERVRLTGWNEPKANILGMVYAWLSDENNGRWIMVVDNADNTDVMFEPRDGGAREQGRPTISVTGHSLSDYLPSSANGSIVITSRTRKVIERLIEYEEDILEVEPMTETEAVSLLTRKLKRREGNDIAQEDLIGLVRRLDHIPLAITQAASCINQRAARMSVSKYLEVLEGRDEERAKLLLLDIPDPRRDGQASNSVIATWHISFDYLWHSRHSAARLLALMSLFDREGIPDHLLRDRYLVDQSDEADFEEDIATLTAYSLVGMGLTNDVYEMHRLVQFSTKKWLEVHNELSRWQERYVGILGAAFPTGDYANWSTCQVLFPHVNATNGYQLTSEEFLLTWATIQYRGAWYGLGVGRYGVSERMARSSFRAREAVLGLNDARTLDSLDYLAEVLRYRGKYVEAEEMHRRAVARREKVLGVDHPSTLTSVDNLAVMLRDRGKYEEAEEIHGRAVGGRETVLGLDHPDTLESVSNLAGVLQDRGKYEEAETLNRRAVAGREKELGVDHPSTLTSVSNLALMLQYRGKYEEAESLNRRALAGREKELGVGHTSTLASVNNLAGVLGYRGKYEEAETLNRRALAGMEKELGVDHPSTLTSVNNLAGVLQDQGKNEEAEMLNRRALAGREKELGVDHPSTLTSVNNLASVLRHRGKYEEAEMLNRRALAGREKELGEDHPSTLTSVSNLALVLQYRGKYEEAEALNRRALAGREKELGVDHPDTLASVYNLAYLLDHLRNYDDALDLYDRAVAGYDRVLGPTHPTALACQRHWASLLEKLSRS